MSTTLAAPPGEAVGKHRVDHAGALSHRRILIVLSGLMLGMFLAALDQTIVATSIRTIADDLKGLDLQAWATTAYLITSTIATPLYGKLSDQYGRKPYFIFAIVIFTIGSLACTFAQSMYMLAAFRAVQGIGAGGLMSLALAIIGDIVPPRERAKYQGYFLAVFGTSSIVGPVVGGALAGQESILGIQGWRWVFLVNVPIAIVALIVVSKVLKLPTGGGIRHRMDWAGATSLMVGLVPLLIVVSQGRDWGWGSPMSLACYGVGVIGLVAFVLAEHRIGDDALVPLKLFRSGVFSTVNAGGLLIGLAMFGGISMLPQFLQIVRGASPTASGLLMLPFVLGMMVFSVLSGQLTARTGHYKIFPVIGTALLVAASLLFYFRLGADMPLWETDVYMVIFGAGLGLCMQTLTLAAQNAVPAMDMGVATSTSTSFRQLGGTLGVAIFFSVLFTTVGGNIKSAFADAFHTTAFQSALHDPSVLNNPVNKPVVDMLSGGGAGTGGSGVLQDSSFLQQIDHRLAHPFLVGFSQSMTVVFLCAAGIAFLAFLLFLFMKEVPLRGKSGIEAAAEDRAKAEVNHHEVDGHTEYEFDRVAESGERQEGSRERSGETIDEQLLAAAPVVAGQHSLVDQDGPMVAVTAGKVGVETMASASTGGGFTQPQTAGAQIRGQVRRADGTGIPDAALTLIDLGGRQVGRAVASPDGSYRVDTPGAGSYVLIASAGAHQPEASSVVVGEGPTDVDIVLTGTSGLAGTVSLAGTGAAVAGATTTLADGRGEVVGAQLTGADGGYCFTELVAGGYTLVVSSDSHRPVARTVTVPGTGQARQDVELTGGARLHGVARAGSTGRPVIDARITLLDSSGNVVGVTDTGDDGEYSFGELAEGEYTVIASGYPPVASTLLVEGGSQGEHDVELGHPEA